MGSKGVPDDPRLRIVIDFGYAIYSGIGLTPPRQISLHTLLLHEITHGLGFFSGSTPENAFQQKLRSYFELLHQIDNQRIFTESDGMYTRNDPSDLHGGKVVFAGPRSVAAYGTFVPIKSVDPWQSANLSHWDDSVKGRPVMASKTIAGASRLYYADYEVGALQDIGWSKARSLAEYRFEGIFQFDGPAIGRTDLELVNESGHAVRSVVISSTSSFAMRNVVPDRYRFRIPASIRQNYALESFECDVTHCYSAFYTMPEEGGMVPVSYEFGTTESVIEPPAPDNNPEVATESDQSDSNPPESDANTNAPEPAEPVSEGNRETISEGSKKSGGAISFGIWLLVILSLRRQRNPKTWLGEHQLHRVIQQHHYSPGCWCYQSGLRSLLAITR